MFKELFFNFFKVIKALITREVIIECDRIPFRFCNVPLKKILNWIKVELSVIIKPEKPWGLPTHLQIEPSTLCNLKCTLCPLVEGLDRPTGNMNFNCFKNMVDEIGDYVFLILLWDWGEPFIHPQIFDFISYAKKKGIKVVSSTNCHAFTQETNAEKVVKSGLDSLITAIDGVSQDTYERYRQGGNLESVFQGIENIISQKKKLNSKSPFINFRFIVMKSNEHEIPKVKTIAKSLGVDALTFKTLNPHSDHASDTEEEAKNQDWKDFIPKDTKYRRFNYDENYEPVHVQKNPCKSLWNCPTIHWNGKVCICTFDYDEKFVLGDLNKDTFKDIWFGDKYKDVRRGFHKDWKKMNPCNSCSYSYEGGSCLGGTIKEAFFFNSKSYA